MEKKIIPKILQFLKKMQNKKIIKNINFYCLKSLLFKESLETIFVVFCLLEFSNSGNTCIPEKFFTKKIFLLHPSKIYFKFWNILKIKNKNWWENIKINYLYDGNKKKKILILYKKNIFFYKNWFSEKNISNFIKKNNYIEKKSIIKYKKNYDLFCDSSLDKLQKIAIGISILNNISFIIGGPGTGKTNIIAYIILIIKYSTKKKFNYYVLQENQLLD